MKTNTLKTVAISLSLLSAQALFAQSDYRSQEQNSSIVQMSQEGVDLAPQMQMNPMGLDELNTLVDWLIGIRPVSGEAKEIVNRASLEEDLQVAENIKVEAISGKDAALTSFISDTKESTFSGKKTISDKTAEGFANKLEAARLNCEGQAERFFIKSEEVRQSDPSKSVALAHIAQVYETAAEQSWLAEKVWIAMANKKAIKVNKTSFMSVDPAERAKKDAAKAVLDKTVEIVKLSPPLRSAELFKNADAAWDRAKEAWNERISAQQQHETKDALLEKAKEAFENEKVVLAEKANRKHKTFLGKVARAAEGAGQALLNVNFLGLSPAFIPSVLGQVASAFNEKAIKKEFKEAQKSLEAAAEQQKVAAEVVQNFEEVAPQTEMNAEEEEEHARNYYTKVARLAARSTTSSRWEERIRASEQVLTALEAEGMAIINTLKAEFDKTAQKAKDARIAANNAKTNLKEAQDRLAKAKEALSKWTNVTVANKALAINDPDAKMRLENEFIEARKNLNKCYELNNPNNSPEANALEQLATTEEDKAISNLQAYLNKKDYLLRGIHRAQSCLTADKAAWIAFWPEEALRKIGKEEPVVSPSSSFSITSPNNKTAKASKVEVSEGKSTGEEITTVLTGMNIGSPLSQNTKSSELGEGDTSSGEDFTAGDSTETISILNNM